MGKAGGGGGWVGGYREPIGGSEPGPVHTLSIGMSPIGCVSKIAVVSTHNI